MSYEYFDELSPEALGRYKTKLNLCDLMECPYRLPADSWKNNPKSWPKFEYPQLYHYLIKHPRVFSMEQMENYKSLEAIKYFKSGWVGTIENIKTTKCFVFKTEVKPSYRVTESPHKPWVAVDKDGTVITGHCTCMAGLGESCSHVAATLFKIEAAVRLGYTSSACTDEPCKWNACFTTDVEPKPIKDIEFYRNESKNKCKETVAENGLFFNKNGFLQNIANHNKKIVGLSAFSKYQENFVSKKESVKKLTLPKSFKTFFNEKNQQLSKQELEKLCEDTFKSISLDTSQIKYVEEISRTQSENSTWHELRLGRITSSVAHKVLRTNVTAPAKSLIHQICHPRILNSNSIPALRHGIENEPNAFDLVKFINKRGLAPNVAPKEVIIKTKFPHQKFSIAKTGLHLSKEKPFLGASPDGLVECECCGKGILEIKCPFKFIETGVKDINGKKTYCITNDFKLSNKHEYYSQVQHQMYILGCVYADFMVWTPKSALLIRVPRDDAYIDVAINKFETIWRNFILPELLTHNLLTPSVQSKRKRQSYCYCKTTNNFTDMVGCDACNDWFHAKCLGYKKVPSAKVWYCPECRKTK